MTTNAASPGAFVEDVITPSGVVVSIPAHLSTPHVINAILKIDQELPPDADVNERRWLVTSQLLRRLAGVQKTHENAIGRLEAELRLVEIFHRRRIDEARAEYVALEQVIAHLATLVKFPAGRKSMSTPYGTVGTRTENKNGTIEKIEKADDPNADLKFAAWALEHMPGECRLFEVVLGDEDVYRKAAEDIRLALASEGLAVLDGGGKVGQAREHLTTLYQIELPAAKAVKARYKETKTVPAGWQFVAESETGYVKCDGPASREVEAVDVVVPAQLGAADDE